MGEPTFSDRQVDALLHHRQGSRDKSAKAYNPADLVVPVAKMKQVWEAWLKDEAHTQEPETPLDVMWRVLTLHRHPECARPPRCHAFLKESILLQRSKPSTLARRPRVSTDTDCYIAACDWLNKKPPANDVCVFVT